MWVTCNYSAFKSVMQTSGPLSPGKHRDDESAWIVLDLFDQGTEKDWKEQKFKSVLSKKKRTNNDLVAQFSPSLICVSQCNQQCSQLDHFTKNHSNWTKVP